MHGMDKDNFDFISCDFSFGDMPCINGQAFVSYYFETYDFVDSCFNTYNISADGFLFKQSQKLTSYDMTIEDNTSSISLPMIAENPEIVFEHTGAIVFGTHDVDPNDNTNILRFYVYGAYFLQGKLQFIQEIDCGGDNTDMFNGVAQQKFINAYENMCLTQATQNKGGCSLLSKI